MKKEKMLRAFKKAFILVLGSVIMFSCTKKEKGNSVFGLSGRNLNLFLNLDEKCNGKNLLFSNAGIDAVMELVRLSANGETKKQIEKVFGVNDKNLNSSIVNIYNFMVSNESNNFAKTKDSYLEKIKKLSYIKADVFKLDSVDNADKLADIVNNKVREVTNGQIDGAVDANLYKDPLFKAQFANVIHFLGKWAYCYDNGYNTDNLYFKNIDGKKASTNFFFTNTNDSDLYENDDIMAFSLDYKEEDKRYKYIAMISKDENKDYKNLDLTNLYAYDGEYIIDTGTPCYEYDIELDLNDSLKRLGVTDMFDENKADLSNAFEKVSGNAYVSKVSQKAKIKVNEFGTEASAFTSAAVAAGACAPIEKPKKKVRYVRIILNRPFIYMIYDSKENMPLFIGKLNETTDNGQDVSNYYKDIETIVDKEIEVDIDTETKNGDK